MKRMTRFSGLLESFECGSLAERQQLLGQNPPMFPPWIPPNLAEKYAFPSVFDSSLYALAGEALACEPTCTESIVAILKDATLHKAKGSKISITWSASAEATCYHFFSPPVLERNLDLFWSCWNPNCPIIHQPTFSNARSWPGLVAAMAVLGACLSPHHSDRAYASLWFNSLEEAIFGDEILLDDSISVAHGTEARGEEAYRRLEAIQAAYLVCLVQNWEGSKPNKRRIRSQRYPTVLAVRLISS